MTKKTNGASLFAILLILFIIIAAIVIVVKVTGSNKVSLETITAEDVNYYVLRQNGKAGVLDKRGRVVIEPTYANVVIPNPTKDVFIVTDNYDDTATKWYAVNSKNEKVLTGYSEVQAIETDSLATYVPYEKTTLIYKENNLYGIMKFNGSKITNAIYEEISAVTYKEGYLKVKKDGRYGVINIDGKTVIPTEYDDISADGYYSLEDKYAEAGFVLKIRTDNGYKYGYANSKGKVILNTNYNEVYRLTEIESKDIYLLVSSNGKNGVMKNGDELIPIEFENVEYIINLNAFMVEQNEAVGMYNMKGETVIPVDYSNITVGWEYVVAYKGDIRTVFDASGNEIQSNFESYKRVNDEYAIVIDANGEYNIVDNNDATTLNGAYIYLEYYNNGLFIATKDNMTGLIDAHGVIKVPFVYSTVQVIGGTELLQAFTYNEDRMDIINPNGNVMEGLTGARLEKKDTYVKIYSNTDVKYYNLDGTETTYKELFPKEKLFASKQNDKWGFADADGNVVVNYQYDMVTEFENGFAGIKSGDVWGIIDESGNVIKQPCYTLSNEEHSFLGEYYELLDGTTVPEYCGDII